MNIKEIVEGMTAPQVAQVIKDNFNEVDKDKANKTDLNKSISDLASVVEANKTDLTKKIDDNKNETDAKLSELGSKVVSEEITKTDRTLVASASKEANLIYTETINVNKGKVIEVSLTNIGTLASASATIVVKSGENELFRDNVSNVAAGDVVTRRVELNDNATSVLFHCFEPYTFKIEEIFETSVLKHGDKRINLDSSFIYDTSIERTQSEINNEVREINNLIAQEGVLAIKKEERINVLKEDVADNVIKDVEYDLGSDIIIATITNTGSSSGNATIKCFDGEEETYRDSVSALEPGASMTREIFTGRNTTKMRFYCRSNYRYSIDINKNVNELKANGKRIAIDSSCIYDTQLHQSQSEFNREVKDNYVSLSKKKLVSILEGEKEGHSIEEYDCVVDDNTIYVSFTNIGELVGDATLVCFDDNVEIFRRAINDIPVNQTIEERVSVQKLTKIRLYTQFACRYNVSVNISTIKNKDEVINISTDNLYDSNINKSQSDLNKITNSLEKYLDVNENKIKLLSHTNSPKQTENIPVGYVTSIGEEYEITLSELGSDNNKVSISLGSKSTSVQRILSDYIPKEGETIRFTCNCEEEYWRIYTTEAVTITINSIQRESSLVNKIVFGTEERLGVRNEIFIAAYNASLIDKANAAFVCDGINDEEEINKAISLCGVTSTIILSAGDFYIDSFNSYDGFPKTAIAIVSKHYNISFTLKGATHYPQGYEGTTRLIVREQAFNDIAAEEVPCVINCLNTVNKTTESMEKYWNINIQNMYITLPNANHNCICLNLMNASSGEEKNLAFSTYGERSGEELPPDIDLTKTPENLIAVRSFRGWTIGDTVRMDNIIAGGFHVGFQLGGEHLICNNLRSRINYIGYTFGQYHAECLRGAFNHPITLINCCDEQSHDGPIFYYCGLLNKQDFDASLDKKLQGITFIDFNTEGSAKAYEVEPGSFCGRIEYHPSSGTYGGIVDEKFWKDKVSGHNFTTINTTHARGGTSALRRTYAPNYMQQYYDTDLSKLLVYNGDNWINIVDGSIVD